MKTYYSTWERNFIAKWKYLVPVVMEGGWVKNSHGNSILGDGYANYAEVRQGEFDEAKTACVNMMDLRYNSDFHNGEAYSWFNEAFQLVKQSVQKEATVYFRTGFLCLQLSLMVNRLK